MSAPPTPTQAEELAAAQRAGEAEWFIVQNPGSGQVQGNEKREVIERVLNEHGRRHRFVPVGAGGMLVACQLGAQWAKSEGGILIAAGGDGTLNCAAQAAMRHGVPLGVIPQGTFNLFARDHGMPEDPAESVRALFDARPVPVQVGLVNERVFLANAALGLYPKLLEDREAAKEQMGKRRRWIAVMAGLVSLIEWNWQMKLDVEMDGDMKRLKTPSLFVCNNRLQLERIGVDCASVGDGRLAALIAHPLDLWTKLKLIVRAMAGRLGDAREVDCLSMRSLQVSLRHARKIKVATDGEVQWMQLPLRFTVAPQPLMLLLPMPR
jgi:diacylglycerol kinase family enzyme